MDTEENVTKNTDVDEMKEAEVKVVKIIDHIRPYINNDGGDIQFVSFIDGIVTVRLLGACAGCGLIDTTLNDGIKAWILEEVPQVKDVVLQQETYDWTSSYDF